MNIEVLDKDLPNRVKSIDEMDIMSKFHEELDYFEDELRKDPNIKSEQFEEILYEGLIGLLDDVKDRESFDIILKKLDNKQEKITIEDIDIIRFVLGNLEDKEIDKSDLNELAEAIDAIRGERKGLRSLEGETLRHAYNENQNTKKLEKARTKLTGYTDKIKGFKTQHPIWTKALISLLPASITAHFFKEASKKKGGSSFDFSQIIEQFQSGLASVAAGFFGWFAPKEMKDLLAEMKDFSVNMPEGFVDFMGGKEIGDFAGAVAERVDEATDKLGDLTGNQLNRLQDGLHNYFSDSIKENLNPNMKDEDFDKFYTTWFAKLKKRGISIKGDFEGFMKDIQKGDINMDVVFSSLGLGIMSSLDFINLANQNNIIDAKYVGMNILEKGGEIVFESVMFFPNMANMVLGKGSLENFYTSLREIGPDSLSDDYKNMILANIYRLLNFTTTGNILKNIAATPFHFLSLASGQLSEGVSKGKIVLDSIMGKSDNKLKVLGEIEGLLGGKGAYKEVMEVSKEYERACIVSTAFSQSGGDYNNFKKILQNANLEKLLEDEPQLKKLTPDNFKDAGKFISTYLGEVSVRIKAPLSQAKNIVETVKVGATGIFSKTKLLQEATDVYSKSLLHNSEMLKNDEIWKFFQKYPNLLKKTIAESRITNILDLASIQGEVKSIGGFFNELRVLIKQSPEFGKFIFGHAPVLLLGGIHMKEMFKDGLKGEWSEAGKEFMKFGAELTPIVGPIVLSVDEGQKGNYMAAGANAVWVGIDSYILYKVSKSASSGILKTGVKMTYKPIVDTGKFALQSIKAVGKLGDDAIQVAKNGFTKEALKIFGQSIKGKSGRLAFVIGAIAVMGYTAKEIKTEFDTWKIDDKITTFADIASQKGGSTVLERYLSKNFKNFNKETQKAILIYVFNTYLGSPMNPIIEDLEINKETKSLHITDYRTESRNIVIENLNRFVGISNKLGYKFEMTGKDGKSIYFG